MKTPRIAALVTATLIAFGGCSSSTDDATSAPETSSPSTSIALTEGDDVVVEEVPVESPALIELEKRKDGTYDRGVRATLGGIVAWEVRQGVKLPIGTKLGERADVFLADHLLREDRWLGSHAIKAGEMDALAETFAPKLYATVEKSVMFFDSLRKQSGGDPKKYPAAKKKQVPAHARTVGYFLLNTSTVDGGKGPIRNEITDKVVWIPESGTAKGLINTWISLKTWRENNSGTGKEFAIWQAWKQVDGEWRIVNTGWSAR